MSFWGGIDAATGRIIGRHSRAGESIAGKVLVMPSGRGSSSSSSVLAEAISRSTAPAGIILGHSDEIVALGALVARELYNITCPVVVLAAHDLDRIGDGTKVRIDPDGTVTF